MGTESLLQQNQSLVKDLLKNGLGWEEILKALGINHHILRFKMMQQDRVQAYTGCYKVLRQGATDKLAGRVPSPEPPLLFPQARVAGPSESKIMTETLEQQFEAVKKATNKSH